MPVMPIIQGVSQVGGLINAFKGPSGGMSYEDALRQATAELSPQWEQTENKTLANIDKNSAARGFFGQLPTAVFKRSTAGQIETDKNSAITNYARQLMSDSRSQSQQDYANQANAWNQLGSVAEKNTDPYSVLDFSGIWSKKKNNPTPSTSGSNPYNLKIGSSIDPSVLS